MCSKMAAKLINSSDVSSMGSAVYFSRRVFTENLKQKHIEKEELKNIYIGQSNGNKIYFSALNFEMVVFAAQADAVRPCTVPT